MRRLIVGLLVFGFSEGVRSAEQLSWKTSVAETAKSNSSLRSAEKNLQSSEYSAKGAYSVFFPQLSGTAGYSRSNTSLSAVPGATNNYNLTLSASESLFAGFQDKGRIDQADAAVRIAQTTLVSVRAQISFDLKSAYAALTVAERAVKLQENIIHRREENFRLVELHFESGLENKGSVLLSQANLDQARYDLLVASNNVRVAQAQLARVLGRNEVSDFIVDDNVPVQEPPLSPDFGALVLSTPDLRQAKAQEESAAAAVLVGRSGFYPTLSLNGSIGRQDTSWFPQNDHWSAGATFTFPLFSGGRDYYATESALAGAVAATSTRRDLERSLLAKLRQNHASYVQAVEKLKVDEGFQRAALMRAEIARNKYNNGLLSFEEWDIIENDLINRQQSVLQSQRNRVAAEAAWEQALGKGVLS